MTVKHRQEVWCQTCRTYHSDFQPAFLLINTACLAEKQQIPVSFLSYTSPLFLSLIHFLLLVYIFPIFTLSFLSFPCPIFLSLIPFLLLVYIFPIFHSVIYFLHEPSLPQLDPFPSISVHISYFHIVISFLHKPYLSQLDPFPSISVRISYLPQCHFLPTRTLSSSA